jgi:hypothetical protein
MSLVQKVRLAAEILWTYGGVKRRLRANDLPATLDELRDGPLRSILGGGGVGLPEAARLGRAVSRTLTPLPTDASCLVQSVVLSTLLARRATPSAVVIGVRPGQAFGAHAWVEVDGQPLLPTHAPEYERLTAL